LTKVFLFAARSEVLETAKSSLGWKWSHPIAQAPFSRTASAIKFRRLVVVQGNTIIMKVKALRKFSTRTEM